MNVIDLLSSFDWNWISETGNLMLIYLLAAMVPVLFFVFFYEVKNENLSGVQDVLVYKKRLNKKYRASTSRPFAGNAGLADYILPVSIAAVVILVLQFRGETMHVLADSVGVASVTATLTGLTVAVVSLMSIAKRRNYLFFSSTDVLENENIISWVEISVISAVMVLSSAVLSSIFAMNACGRVEDRPISVVLTIIFLATVACNVISLVVIGRKMKNFFLKDYGIKILSKTYKFLSWDIDCKKLVYDDTVSLNDMHHYSDFLKEEYIQHARKMKGKDYAISLRIDAGHGGILTRFFILEIPLILLACYLWFVFQMNEIGYSNGRKLFALAVTAGVLFLPSLCLKFSDKDECAKGEK